MAVNSQFRDVFNIRGCHELAERIWVVYGCFDRKRFLAIIQPAFKKLTFSERNLRIADALKQTLPESFPEAVDILLKAQTEQLEGESPDYFKNFIVMPQATFISLFGMDSVDLSLKALEEMTKRFSSEFAIRYFIRRYPEKTFKQIKKWAADKNCHVRRLASEGTRPRLPWGIRLTEFIEDPSPVLKILDIMKFAPERVVQRSIANSLNDMSKDNPQVVTTTLERWHKEGVAKWLITHSLRTLLKQGNLEALQLCGYDPQAKIEMTDFVVMTPEVELGSHLEFSFVLKSGKGEKLMIDFIIHHVKANGDWSPKVFKLTRKCVAGSLMIHKKHSMRAITTRKYYAGTHLLQIQVNGKVLAEQEFTLKIGR